MPDTFDLSGRRYTGLITVVLHPHVGIQYEGKHIEGGPHALPFALAQQLINTGRAKIVEAVAAPTEPEYHDPAPTSKRKA